MSFLQLPKFTMLVLLCLCYLLISGGDSVPITTTTPHISISRRMKNDVPLESVESNELTGPPSGNRRLSRSNGGRYNFDITTTGRDGILPISRFRNDDNNNNFEQDNIHSSTSHQFHTIQNDHSQSHDPTDQEDQELQAMIDRALKGHANAAENGFPRKPMRKVYKSKLFRIPEGDEEFSDEVLSNEVPSDEAPSTSRKPWYRNPWPRLRNNRNS